MSGRKGKRLVIKLLAILAAVVVIGLGATVFCAWYSNGWESVSPFYIKHSGTVAGAELNLTGGRVAAIEVRSAGFNKSVEGYIVQVVPDSDSDLDYTVDGLRYRFSALGDVTEQFNVRIYKNYFTITPHTPENLLKGLYGGAQIEIVDKPEAGKSYFKIVVTSADGNKRKVLSLKVSGSVTSIKFNTDNIVL